jgi:hypothetical protein
MSAHNATWHLEENVVLVNRDPAPFRRLCLLHAALLLVWACSASAQTAELVPAAGSGNTLTLTLNVRFSSSFVGERIIYMAARDVAEPNSGWQAMGRWTAP